MAMLKTLNRAGLFGGTFNPIHHGHLKMAESARKEYKLDVIYFIPCGMPPHKSKKDLLSTKLRMKLLKKAIQGKKYFKVLNIEIKKKKPCYTVDTILSLRGALATKQSHFCFNSRRLLRQGCALPRNDVKLYFLIGQDEFEDLHTWHKPNKLAKLVTFLVLPRGSKKIKLPKVGTGRDQSLQWFKVHRKPINISSSQIREK